MEELILLSSLHLETGFGRRVEDFELNPKPKALNRKEAVRIEALGHSDCHAEG